MSKKSIFLMKVPANIAYQAGVKNVLVGKYSKDTELLNKIKDECRADVWQYRNLKFHQKLFAIANECIESYSFWNKLLNKWPDAMNLFDIKIQISEEAITAIRAQNNDDPYSLIYICKSIFLPWIKKVEINGKFSWHVNSIAFENMDNLVYEEFYNKCIALWSFILDINPAIWDSKFNIE